MSFRRLWLGFAAVVILSFAVLGWTGIRIYQQAPPVPERVITADGRELIGPGVIHAGQNVWQSLGGMEVGSIWGHGSYVAPDWTADWLHREAMFILERWARLPAAFTRAARRNGRPSCRAGCSSCCARNTYDAAHRHDHGRSDPRAGVRSQRSPTTRTCSRTAATSTPFPRAR